MALTVTPVLRTVFGNKRVTVNTVTFDSSYLSGGESLTAADLGLKNVETTLVGSATGAIVSYNPATAILKAYILPALDGNSRGTSAIPEVVSTTDVSGVIVTILAIGL